MGGVLLLAAVAALLYNSWPLGFVLNPTVVRHALASVLEAPHQPYDWVFVSMDVASGVLAIALGYLQLRKHPAGLPAKAAVVSYMLFGALVMCAALIPLRCDPTSQQCGPLMHDPQLLLHGVCSIASTFALLVSLLWAVRALAHASVGRRLRKIAAAVGGCWLAFAGASLLEMNGLLHLAGNVTEYFFITVCGMSLVLIALMVEYAALHQNASLRAPLGFFEDQRNGSQK